MKTVTTIIDGHEMEVPEHLMAEKVVSEKFLVEITEARRKLAAHDDLVAALKTVTSLLDSENKGTDRPSSYVSDQVYKARAALKKAGAA